MAASTALLRADESLTIIAHETLVVDMDVDTSITITPTKIKQILNVVITPTNAAAAAAATTTILDTFVPGDSTVTITTLANTTFLVTILGTVA